MQCKLSHAAWSIALHDMHVSSLWSLMATHNLPLKGKPVTSPTQRSPGKDKDGFPLQEVHQLASLGFDDISGDDISGYQYFLPFSDTSSPFPSPFPFSTSSPFPSPSPSPFSAASTSLPPHMCGVLKVQVATMLKVCYTTR